LGYFEIISSRIQKYAEEETNAPRKYSIHLLSIVIFAENIRSLVSKDAGCGQRNHQDHRQINAGTPHFGRRKSQCQEIDGYRTNIYNSFRIIGSSPSYRLFRRTTKKNKTLVNGGRSNSSWCRHGAVRRQTTPLGNFSAVFSQRNKPFKGFLVVLSLPLPSAVNQPFGSKFPLV
jgi:hypothetical protein